VRGLFYITRQNPEISATLRFSKSSSSPQRSLTLWVSRSSLATMTVCTLPALIRARRRLEAGSVERLGGFPAVDDHLEEFCAFGPLPWRGSWLPALRATLRTPLANLWKLEHSRWLSCHTALIELSLHASPSRSQGQYLKATWCPDFRKLSIAGDGRPRGAPKSLQ